MAKQDGVLELKGSSGSLTFFKKEGVYMARKKAGTSRDKIMNSPSCARVRENMAEFGRAGKAGKLLRTCFNGLLVNCKDSSRSWRLTAIFRAVVKADSVNERGMRNVLDGETELLEGFEMNRNSGLTSTLFAPFTATIDRVTGDLAVSIAPFVPLNMLNAPAGATHFKINSAGAAIDFENETYEVAVNSTAELPWTNVPTVAITLSNSVAANSTHPLFLALGIEFFQSVNGSMYPLKSGQFNPLAVVKVSGV